MGIYEELGGGYREREAGREFGVITGIIMENWDEAHPGMVKAEFILGEQGKNLTGWIPVCTPYGGEGYGLYALPEIGDVAVIAFERGDRNCPIVIGSLWDNKNTLPVATAKEENTGKRFRTKGGCSILFSDEEEKQKIQINTPKELKITIEDENEKIVLSDQSNENGIEIDSQNGTITISAKSKIELSVGSSPSLILEGDGNEIKQKAGKITVKTDQEFSVKSQNVQIAASMASIKGDSQTKVESGGVLQLKGAMAKIN